jgi:hypothetical protein
MNCAEPSSVHNIAQLRSQASWLHRAALPEKAIAVTPMSLNESRVRFGSAPRKGTPCALTASIEAAFGDRLRRLELPPAHP